MRSPACTLQAIATARGTGAAVPTSAIARNTSVDATYHQLRHVESDANSRVERISALPLRGRRAGTATEGWAGASVI